MTARNVTVLPSVTLEVGARLYIKVTHGGSVPTITANGIAFRCVARQPRGVAVFRALANTTGPVTPVIVGDVQAVEWRCFHPSTLPPPMADPRPWR